MEAEVLLGKNLNLDKARQLSLAGDLEGLQKEILKNVGSEAEFNAMNVVQRQALAKSLGMNVADLGKMVAGEKTSAQIQEEQAETQRKQLDLQTQLMTVMAAGKGIEMAILAVKGAQALADTKIMAKAAAKIGMQSTLFGLSLGTASAALTATIVGIPLIAGLLALAFGAFSKGKASGMADGGVVGKDGGNIAASDTIPTMLTPGEVVLNAAQQSNVAGAIGGEPKQLIALQKKTNELLNTLIRKTGEQALTS